MDHTKNLLEGITKYLDYSGQFNCLLKAIEDFEKTLNSEEDKFLPMFFTVKVDFPLLTDISGQVSDLLLNEPFVAKKLFSKVINLAIKSQEIRSRKIIGEIQIEIHTNLPLLPDIVLYSDKSFHRRSGLFVIKGILIAHTAVIKYCKSALYQCTQEGCVGSKGERVFGNLNTTSLCKYCGCVKREDLRARLSGDQLSAVFVNPQGFQPNFSRYEGLTVLFRDNLVQDLKLGTCYNVVASFKFPDYIGWGVEKTISEHQWRCNKNLPIVGIPPSLLSLEEYLQKKCPNSPWAFSVTLSSYIASGLYPVTSFFHLKTGLLLSLASQGEDQVPIPILAVGPDCYSILNAATLLAHHRLTLTSPSLCGSVCGTIGEPWIEAGPLLLASGGVYYVGDWAKFGGGRSNVASQIIAAVESSKISLVSSTNPLSCSPPSLPLKAAVWTFWSGEKATNAAQAQLRTLIEVFGMPFIGDGGADVETVANYLLLESMQTEARTPKHTISNKEFKEYLNIVRSLKVQLTPDATRLLRNYFVASRRERPDCLPLKAIHTMTSLAEAHARLCLRTQVMCEDVVLVAYLYEEAITALFGRTVMSPPTTIFGGLTENIETFSVAEQVTLSLRHFSVWLDQYIKSLLNENSASNSLCEE